MSKSKKIATSALFVALMIVGAFIKIPMPPVPFTLQSFFAVMSGLILGGVTGFSTILIYIFLGLIGLPVFSSGGGLSYILTPTFGFLIGMAFASLFSGIIIQNSKSKSILSIVFAQIVETILVYLFGVTYFYLISRFYLGSEITIKYVMIFTCLIFLPKDLLTIALGTVITKRLYDNGYTLK